jgi:hypothetical protein
MIILVDSTLFKRRVGSVEDCIDVTNFSTQGFIEYETKRSKGTSPLKGGVGSIDDYIDMTTFSTKG